MSGYKRVNFYELCRLCATNQQKEKTHIFHEEGRKIQLQNKIQSCLSLTVCENDFLPKVVCSQCLRSLEECYIFRKECVSSESMLSSYFKNFRYTEDFKKSGKVYIKDTSALKTSPTVMQNNSEPVTSTTTNSSNTTVLNNVNLVQDVIRSNGNDQIPMYAVQLPAVIQNDPKTQARIDVNQPKAMQSQPQMTYSINPMNLAAFKNVVPKNDVLVNGCNEVVNVAQLVDLESIICQAGAPKVKVNNAIRTQKHTKTDEKKIQETDQNMIKIELTEADFDINQLKLSHMKNAVPNKFTYSIRLDEGKSLNVNQALILNQLPENNNQQNVNSMNLSQNLGNVYSNTALNANNMNSHQHLNSQSSNIMCNTSNMNTTTNLTQIVQNVDTNVRNYIASAVKQTNFATNNPTEPVFMNTASSSNMSVVKQTTSSNFTNYAVTSDTSAITNVKIHTCDICRKTFKRREHLYQHVKLHTGFRPFTCENCNKSFMRKEHLLRHMTSHSGQKNFTCEICEKSFSRNDNLLKHKKTHEKQNSFTCEMCQKQFVMKHYFLAHKLTHESDKCNVNQMWGLLKA